MTTTQTMQGKAVVITGGTGGIGAATALGLARMGAAITIVGRDEGRGRAALAEIKRASGNDNITLALADLSAQADVRRFAAEFSAGHDRLDVLINNIGGLYPARRLTADGIEATFAVNHLNPFLLTHLLLPLLQAGAPSRVINLSSSAHRFGRIDFANLQAERSFRGLSTYANAKLANLTSVYEFARRSAGTGVRFYAADPGTAWTSMSQGMTAAMMPWYLGALWPIARRFMRSTSLDAAASSAIYAATATELTGQSGLYIKPQGKIVRSSKASYDQAAAQRLWRLSEGLAGRTAIPENASAELAMA
jgi:retinol dehydrogenase-14